MGWTTPLHITMMSHSHYNEKKNSFKAFDDDEWPLNILVT